MSIPSGIIRFAGTWSVTQRYIYAELVISPIDSSAYVLVVNSLTGGTDPSTPSANWVLIPSGGGGGGGVTSLNTLTGAIEITGATDDTHPTPTIQVIPIGGSEITLYTNSLMQNGSETVSLTTGAYEGSISLVEPYANGQYSVFFTITSAEALPTWFHTIVKAMNGFNFKINSTDLTTRDLEFCWGTIGGNPVG